MTKTTVVHTPTNDLEQSKDFYSRLKFEILSESSPTIFTDGKALVEINPDRYARAGVKIYGEDLTEEIAALKEVTEVLKTEKGLVASDPNGIWLYLLQSEFGVEYELKEESFGITGNYAGLSIEALDVDKTVAFWEAAGIKHSSGDISQGWAMYSNGCGGDISIMKPLMCPHLFFNPGMTYFNGGKNLTNIGLMREAGIPFTEEITHFSSDGVADNVIIRDPGGLGFFIFND